jgi:hypothetical protein
MLTAVLEIANTLMISAILSVLFWSVSPWVFFFAWGLIGITGWYQYRSIKK